MLAGWTLTIAAAFIQGPVGASILGGLMGLTILAGMR
jgi:hypothetical protein